MCTYSPTTNQYWSDAGWKPMDMSLILERCSILKVCNLHPSVQQSCEAELSLCYLSYFHIYCNMFFCWGTMENKKMKMNCNLCFKKLTKQLGWHIQKKKNLFRKLDLCKNRYIVAVFSKNVYCSNTSTLLMQYIFFYIKKATTCVVLGDKYIDGDFGYGVLQVSSPQTYNGFTIVQQT